MEETRFLIIDGNSIGFRAATSKPPFQDELVNSKGVTTGTAYRFVNILNKVLFMVRPTHILIAFDTSGHTFRKDIDPQYKANRKHSEDKLAIYNQFPDIKRILDAVGIKHDNVFAYEGDDIVGTYKKLSKATKNFILSGDKDIFQLIDDNTSVVFPIKGVSEVGIYDKISFKERFNINVEQFIDYKTLMGDAGDNIFGLDGCGETTAMKILNKFGTIESAMNNLDTENKDIRGWKKLSQKMANWDYAKVRSLVTIHQFVPVNYSFDDCKINLDWRNAIPVFEDLEFNSFIKKAKEDKFYGKTW